MHDVDLLLRPEHIRPAVRAAAEFGFMENPLPNSNTLLSKQTGHRHLHLELHTHICQPLRYPVDRDALWTAARAVQWNGRRMSVLDPAHAFIHTLINLVHDRFDAPLIKFMEAHWQYRRLTPAETQAIAELSTQCECTTAMRLLLDILFDWFGHDKPAGLRAATVDHFDTKRLPPYRAGQSHLRDLMFSSKLIDRPARRVAFAWDALLRRAQIRPRKLDTDLVE